MNLNSCWNCNRKFHGNHIATVIADGHPRHVHKACADELGLDPIATEPAKRQAIAVIPLTAAGVLQPPTRDAVRDWGPAQTANYARRAA